MAFAELSSTLLVRSGNPAPVSVSSEATTPDSYRIRSSASRQRDSKQPLNIARHRAGLIYHSRGIRLSGFVLCCVASVIAGGLFISHYLEPRNASQATNEGLKDTGTNKVDSSLEPTPAIPMQLEEAEVLTLASNEQRTAPDARTNAPLLGVPTEEPPLINTDAEPSSVNSAPPAIRAQSRSETELAALIERGDAFFSSGDVASARLFYQHAAEASDGAAALRLGEAFDPAFLRRARLVRASGDVEQASYWYLRAWELGNSDAEVLLKGLRSSDER